MRGAIRKLAIAAIVCALPLSAAPAQEKLAKEEVEAILVQSLLEQAAFLACAMHANDPETAGYLRRGWQSDLRETATLLRDRAGLAEDFIRQLTARLSLDKAMPKFGDASVAKAFCDTLGDWDRRRAMFFWSIPQVRLGQALKR